ncbi:MAG: NAD(P)H-hydrate epimerase [Candidatus Omnitrophica bacterium]|nr:NAD(P)H-hydrate epimerase [Candidatus Omnitrophota bacterium]
MEEITAKQMQEIDRIAIQDFKIPSIVLMENAGRAAAEVAASMLTDKNKKVVFVCGKGNNGGDGFVCARHLINKGINVDIFLTGNRDQLKGDAKINFLILEKMKAPIYILEEEKKFINLGNKIKNSGLVIDAIFGIGISGEIKKPYSTIIKTINDNKNKTLALDIPSGLDATEGFSLGSCVKADKTVTFAASKTGLVNNQGPSFSGQIIVADISIPREVLRDA